jgi:adenylate kinase
LKRSLLLLGIQGAGKGTVGRLLARDQGMAHLSAGSLLRRHVHDGGPFGEEIKAQIDRGCGVSTEISYGLLKKALADASADRPLVLDGYPREQSEIEHLLELLGVNPTLVLHLQAPRPIAVARLLSRSACDDCDATFGPGVPPRFSGVCDDCGGKLASRKDDTPPAIRCRLDGWTRRGPRILERLREITGCTQIDSSRPIDQVMADVEEALSELPN